MAIPTSRTPGAKASGTGAVTPALPANIAVGDIAILVATTIAAGTITITADGGQAWTAFTGSPIDVASGEKLYVWWRRHAAGNTAPTIAPGSDHICAGINAYAGCVPSGDPVNAAATGTETASDTTFSFTSGISTTLDDCICICICSTGADATSGQFTVMTNGNLSSLAERMDYCTNSGGGGGFAQDEGGLATAGAMGTWASTLSTATPKAYLAFALAPAPFAKSGSDNLTVSTPEGSTGLLGSLDRSDSAALSLTEAQQSLLAADRADSLAVSAADAAEVAGVLDRADALTLSLAEAQDSALSSDRSDVLAIGAGEAAALLSALERADEIALGAQEQSALLAALDAADSLGLSIADLAQLLSLLERADALGISVADLSDALVGQTAADTLALALGEEAVAEVGELIYELNRADVLGLGLTEKQESLVASDRSDALVLLLADLPDLAVILEAVDTLALRLGEDDPLIRALRPLTFLSAASSSLAISVDAASTLRRTAALESKVML